MRRSSKQANGNRAGPSWWRRSHRWLGIVTALFLLLLSVTGIGLNHSDGWQLDRRYISWDWLLDAYGIAAPPPTASFAENGHRATQLGTSLYFDAREAPREIDTLTGMVLLDGLALVASAQTVLLFTTSGEFVQSIDLAAQLPAPIARVGRIGDRPVIESGNAYFIGDADVTTIKAWPAPDAAAVTWSQRDSIPAEQLARLQRHYRGRGLSVERLLLDLHSGRVASRAGTVLMDLLAVGLILLSLTGLFLWLRRGNRRNGNGGQRRRID